MISLASACDILRGVEYNRNVEDDSITIEEKKRDYLLWGQAALLVAGEDKRDQRDLRTAIEDLETKNKGSTLLIIIIFFGSAYNK